MPPINPILTMFLFPIVLTYHGCPSNKFKMALVPINHQDAVMFWQCSCLQIVLNNWDPIQFWNFQRTIQYSLPKLWNPLPSKNHPSFQSIAIEFGRPYLYSTILCDLLKRCSPSFSLSFHKNEGWLILHDLDKKQTCTGQCKNWEGF